MIYVLGGGENLNFKVVGGTSAPSNPKENTIWVNTSTAITSWDFSATEPCCRSGNKNFVVYPYYSTTSTTNGITFTDLGDGRFRVNGTATSTTYFRASYTSESGKMFILSPGTYTLSGCPAGGSQSTYMSQLMYMKSDGTWDNAAWDYGKGATFTVEYTTFFRLSFRVQSGCTVTNLTGYFQLEKGSTATSFVKGDATGQVWIREGTTGIIEFNALKKNGIMLYPLSVKQYVNGAWVNKTAKIYQGGAWVDWWDGKLYESGNEFEYVTGGWYALGKSWDGSQGAGGGTITRNSTTMVMVPTGSPSPVMFILNNKIDLTDYNTLKYNGTFAGTMQDSKWVRMCAWSELGSNIQSNLVAGVSLCVAGSGEKSLDISHLKGEHYVGICFYAKATLTMNKMWLE